jgi:autotransporter-associated beta strand protein
VKALNIVDTSASDDGDLVKTGAGKLVLSGNNSDTGATTVSAGTLAAARAAVKFSWIVILKLLSRTRLFPAGGFDQLEVSGNINLGGASLDLFQDPTLWRRLTTVPFVGRAPTGVAAPKRVSNLRSHFHPLLLTYQTVEHSEALAGAETERVKKGLRDARAASQRPSYPASSW